MNTLQDENDMNSKKMFICTHTHMSTAVSEWRY